MDSSPGLPWPEEPSDDMEDGTKKGLRFTSLHIVIYSDKLTVMVMELITVMVLWITNLLFDSWEVEYWTSPPPPDPDMLRLGRLSIFNVIDQKMIILNRMAENYLSNEIVLIKSIMLASRFNSHGRSC